MKGYVVILCLNNCLLEAEEPAFNLNYCIYLRLVTSSSQNSTLTAHDRFGFLRRCTTSSSMSLEYELMSKNNLNIENKFHPRDSLIFPGPFHTQGQIRASS